MTETTIPALDATVVTQRTFFADVLGARPLPDGVTLAPLGPAEFTLTELRTLHETTDATVFWIHGGGYVAGTVRQSIGPAANVALAASVRIVAPDYPLAPEHPYPAALDHVLDGYRWVLEQEGASRVILAGESAGGGLALALLQRARTAGLPSPARLVLVSPALDLTGSGRSFRGRADEERVLHPDELAANFRMYAGSTPLDDPAVSPLFGDLAELPPVYVQVGTAEILLDDAVRLAAGIADSGGDVVLDVVRGGTHGLQRTALARLADFIRRVAANS